MHVWERIKQERSMVMKKRSARIVVIAAVAAFASVTAALAACDGKGSLHHGAAMSGKESAMVASKTPDIVEVAMKAGSFSTLVAAVKAADLVRVLQGEGPFTVFAPTDEAFAKLPEGTVAELLKPENKEKLQAILTYHVVPGKVTSSQVVALESAKTVQGQKVDIKVSEGQVMIDDAKVMKVDIEASNGVIHVIDSVILPRPM
jgi:uncharacterized surface protein with fasciclin (FAS1) repeats